MELSGLIFVALAVVWAVVLIPQALRQHDENARTRSVDEVSDDVRVIVRRKTQALDASAPSGETATPKTAPAPRESAPASGTATMPSAPKDPWAVLRHRLEASRTAAQAAARRRRRVLGLLALLTAGVCTPTVMGLLPWWAPIAPGVGMLGFLVVARLTVRRERTRWTEELTRLRRIAERADAERRSKITPAPADPAPAAPAYAEVPVQAPSAPAAAVPTAAPQTQAPAPALSVQGALAMAEPVAAVQPDTRAATQPEPTAGSLWDPLPMTLPTYVTKPRAERTVRTIDLSAPGVSSSGRDAAESALVAESATSPASGEEGDARRAVGG